MKVFRDIMLFLVSKWWIFIPSAMAVVWVLFRIKSNASQLSPQQGATVAANLSDGITVLPTDPSSLIDQYNSGAIPDPGGG